MQIADLILKSYVNSTIDQLDKRCTEDAPACDGVVITNDQEEILASVLQDGIINDYDKRLLKGFLRDDVILGIAGEDGTKPGRMKAAALIAKLRSAKVDAIPQLMEELATLGEGVRPQVVPVVRLVLERLCPGSGREPSAHTKELSHELSAVESRITTTIADTLDPHGDHEGSLPERLQPYFDQRKRILASMPPASRAVAGSEQAVVALNRYLAESITPIWPRDLSDSAFETMTVEQLEAVTQHDADYGMVRKATRVMIRRFPDDARTDRRCHEVMRKEPWGDFGNAYHTAVAEYVSRFRMRLEPMISEIHELSLPALLLAHPEQNVSDLIIPRIMSAKQDAEWKGKAFAAAAEKADRATFERMVAAAKGDLYVGRAFAKHSARYQAVVDAERKQRDDAKHDESTLNALSDFTTCYALAAKRGSPACDDLMTAWYLSNGQRNFVRSQMDAGAAQFILTRDYTIHAIPAQK